MRRSLLVEALESRRLLSAAVIADINQLPVSSEPSALTWAGDKLFFFANTPNIGSELWVTDSGGPRLVKDINPGSSGSGFPQMIAIGGTVYFTASEPTGGMELWRSDGTAAGTFRVKDITAGAASTSILRLTDVDGTLMFFAQPSSSSGAGYDLWRSDGTEAGTIKLQGHWGESVFHHMATAVVDGSLYFNPIDPTAGIELWKSDGTDAGTMLVKDIVPGSGSSSPEMLTAAGNLLYFRSQNRLWRSDGTDAGTFELQGWGANWPQRMAGVGDRLFVAAGDNTTGTELWTSDGTVAGTRLVKDIRPGTGPSTPQYFVDMGGILYFEATDNYFSGSANRTIWRSDGTESGTYPVFFGGRIDAPYFAHNLTVAGNTLFFTTADNQLWKSDGTAAGTAPIKQFGSHPDGSKYDPQDLTAAGDRIYFNASDSELVSGFELWTSDGTSAGTTMVADLLPGTSSGSPGDLVVAANQLFFSGNDGFIGRELYRTDGTPGGSVLVDDIWLGNTATSSNPTGVSFGGQYYFHAQYDSAGTWHPEGLFRTDGSPGNVVQIAGELNQVRNLTATDTALYYTARFGGTTTGLFRMDTGGASVSRIGTFTFPGQLTAVGNLLYFVASDTAQGVELWRTDGTEAGTFAVADLQPGATSSSPTVLAAIGDTLYFTASDPTLGRALFRTDGTAAGTSVIQAITPVRGSTVVSGAVDVAGTLFYMVGSWPSYELWKSDGTTAGTVLVKTGFGSYFSEMTAVGSTLYMSAQQSGGTELWKSDGTTAGTYRVADIYPGSEGSYPRNLTVVGGTLYFSAKDLTNGQRIWKTDGTEAGTVIASDVPAGPVAANFTHQLVNFNDVLYFTGDDGRSGIELYRLLPDSGMIQLADPVVEATESAGVATITLVRTGGASGAASVAYSTSNGTAIAGTDYHATSGIVTFADGELTKSFNVSLIDNTDPETDEALYLTLTAAGGDAVLGSNGATIVIRDDDQVAISISDVTVTEGNSGQTAATFIVSLSSPLPTPVSMSYSVGDGSAKASVLSADVDFVDDSGTLTIPAGQTSAMINVLVKGDVVSEPDEVFFLNLYNATGLTEIVRPVGTATVLTDDPVVALVGIAVNDGQTQRSMVKRLTVTFDQAVALEAGAFMIAGRYGAGAGTTVSAANPSGDGRTWILTFAGSPVVSGSLADGVYDLTVVAAKVHAAGTSAITMAADRKLTFHRLYGDVNGDRVVGGADYFQFSKAYGKPAPDPLLLAAFDYDDSGSIGGSDFFQFRKRYGKPALAD